MPDKYKAIWLSHSSVNNYNTCPRLYYLANIYKDPRTKNKITVTSPYIALGVAIHNVLEPLANIPSIERSKVDLYKKYDESFECWRGEKGGWSDIDQEHIFYERGKSMISNMVTDIESGSSILLEKSIRPSLYYNGDMIPNIYISQKENIILCGSIDWIAYTENKIIVLDFKTGKNEESDNSKQLLIYKKLFESLQNKWKVNAYAYFYLDKNQIVHKDWSVEEVNKRIDAMLQEFIKVGSEIRDKRYDCMWSKDKTYIEKYIVRDNFEKNFVCKNGPSGCRHCISYEKVLRREAKYVGTSLYGQDMYST